MTVARGHHAILRNTLLSGVIVNAALVGFGVWAYPGVFSGSVRDVVFISLLALTMIAYIVVAFTCTSAKSEPERWAYRRGISYGLMIGLIWLAQTTLETFAQPDDALKANLGVFTFAIVFLLYIAAGLRGAIVSRQPRAGIWTALWAGMVSSLIASAAALIINYVFMETVQANAMHYGDFARANATNLVTFTIQTSISGGFIHLLVIGPLFGLLLGFIGAMAALYSRVPGTITT